MKTRRQLKNDGCSEAADFETVALSDGFYRAFEDRYRGSRELIKSRLECYRPFIEPLLVSDDQANALDLGCGRGEWLELVSEIGFNAVGVDLDQGMLDACNSLGLQVKRADALSFIATVDDNSQAIVSAFHVVEHITFEQQQTLISEALRVLKPGGLLIMETPNPENIVVATKNFYLDPSHQRPIPLELLSFMPEYYGFWRTKIIRLQESKVLTQSSTLTLHDVLEGVSPDYAIVSQKVAAAGILSLFDAPFSHEFGLSLGNLTSRYHDQQSTRFVHVEAKAQHAETMAQQAVIKALHVEAIVQQTEAKVQQSEAKVQQAEAKVQQAEAKVQQAEAKVQQAEAKAQQAEEKAQQAEEKAQQAEEKAQQAEEKAQQAEEKAQQAEEKAQQLEIKALQVEIKAQQTENNIQQVKEKAWLVETKLQQAEERAWRAETASNQHWSQFNAVYSSTSWRITAPLRRAANFVYRLRPSSANSTLVLLAKHAALYVKRRPILKRNLLTVLGHFPGIKSRILSAVQPNVAEYRVEAVGVPTELVHLSPRARRIYAELKLEIEQQQGGR